MGHVTDPNGYNRAQTDLKWVAREYRKVLPWLNIMTSNTPFELYDEEDIEDKIKRESEVRAAELLKLEKAKMKDQVGELVERKLQELAKQKKDLENKALLLEDLD